MYTEVNIRDIVPSDWAVTWRAVDPGGAPDKWYAVAVSHVIATTAAQAIYAAQTVWDQEKHYRCPGRAFVDWQASDGTPGGVDNAVPADVQTAVEELVQQREEDPGPGRYDMVEPGNIDRIIDFLRSRGVDPKPVEPREHVVNRDLAKFDSPEAKRWKADVVEKMARRAAGLEG